LIWKKLRVVDGRLALMQDELALMQNGIKELQIMESRLFNVFMLNADAFKKATDIGLSTSAPAAPSIDAGGQAAPVAVTQRVFFVARGLPALMPVDRSALADIRRRRSTRASPPTHYPKPAPGSS
jgi:hypothetical protein